MNHVIRRGLDIPIQGSASGHPVDLDPPTTAAYAPQEFPGVVPKPALKVGEAVKVGSPLFFHKHDPRIVFRSPVAGRVAEIRRGARRVLTDMVVERDGSEQESFKQWSAAELGAIERTAAVEALLESGLWSALRTRPLDLVPNPATHPQAIWIGALETGPCQPGADVLLGDDDGDALQAAVDVLKVLAPVHVGTGAAVPRAASALNGAEVHTFSGPHPAGDMGVQVNLTCPPRAGGEVWTLRAWDAVLIGRFLLSGRFPTDRIYAAIGAGVKQPRHVRTVLGAPLAHIVGETTTDDARWIRGSVLTGEAVDPARWATFGARAVHVLPTEVPRALFGWAMPQLARWSFHRAYLSGFMGAGTRTHDMRPGTFGGTRAIVSVGYYNKVVATPDILPDFLFKAILSGELEEAITLGLLDITLEEAALCTYICPSKIEFDEILREGLDLYRKEA